MKGDGAREREPLLYYLLVWFVICEYKLEYVTRSERENSVCVAGGLAHRTANNIYILLFLSQVSRIHYQINTNHHHDFYVNDRCRQQRRQWWRRRRVEEANARTQTHSHLIAYTWRERQNKKLLSICSCTKPVELETGNGSVAVTSASADIVDVLPP